MIVRENNPVPKIFVSQEVIATAWNRGFNLRQIAAVLGVSHQAVQQRVARCGLAHTRKKRCRTRPTKTFFKCSFCGETEWRTKVQMRGSLAGNVAKYCSIKCFGKAQRTLSDANVVAAINHRIGGCTWKDTSIHIGEYVQTIQRNIWLYLYEAGFLTEDIVMVIWLPRCTHGPQTPRWGWLERIFGIVPAKTKKYGAFKRFFRWRKYGWPDEYI